MYFILKDIFLQLPEPLFKPNEIMVGLLMLANYLQTLQSESECTQFINKKYSIVLTKCNIIFFTKRLHFKGYFITIPWSPYVNRICLLLLVNFLQILQSE